MIRLLIKQSVARGLVGLTILVIVSCNNPPTTSGVSITVPPNQPISGSIEGLGSIAFASGTFDSSTTVILERTQSEFVAERFVITAELFSAGRDTPGELTVRVGKVQPKQPVEVTLKGSVPVGAGEELRIAYINVYDTGDKRLETVELAPERAQASEMQIKAVLPTEAFYPNAQGDFEAHFFAITTPTAPTIAAAIESGDLRLTAEQCAGSSLTRPVDESFPMTSPFGSRKSPKAGASTNHKGVDFGVPAGSEVRAAADGKMFVRKELNKSGQYKGWGYYVYIKHDDGGATLYAHLQDGSAKLADGTAVKAGDPIALSGNTGVGTGPHLHFEYAPSGKIFVRNEKVNPMPCLEKLASGTLTIRDNGTLADDAFSVSLNGTGVCQTSIGAANSCALGQLRPGNYALVITAVIAPDDVGTFEISVASDSNMAINGIRSVSGTVPQGGSAAYTLNVPSTQAP